MECDLFEPIKSFFESQGYVCDGEVRGIDLFMQKDSSSAAVELKQTLDFRSIQQAALRQKIVETVYIGIETPKNLISRSFKDKIYLLKRLGIGLIVVSKTMRKVSVISEPVVSELSAFQTRNRKQKAALENEFVNRRLKSNIGGVTGEKLMTRYREDALLVLDALMRLGGEAAPKEIRKMCMVEKTANILRDNHYGWFEHVRKGVYALSSEGEKAYSEYTESLKAIREPDLV